MPRVYGVQYPERYLMAVISDLLGIAHYTTSRGSTVRRDFLEAVAARLGVPEAAGLAEKDDVLQACIQAATRAPMDGRLFSRGTTVTNAALQTIIDGIMDNWVGGDDPGVGPADPDLPVGQDALDTPLDELADLLDPDRQFSPEDRRLLAVAYREGQNQFRTEVLAAYAHDDAERCCMTGYGPSQVLEAAHIVPYAEGGPSIVSNGLCLRRDLHTLMDRRLLAVHERTLEVLVHPVLDPTPYGDLAGVVIHVPRRRDLRPAPAALKQRREAAGL